MWTEILAALAGAGGGQVIGYGLRKRKRRTQSVDEWYEEAITLISRGHGICLSARKRSNLNYGDISEESYKISQKLNEHVNPYPDRVDQTAVEQVQSLSMVFRKMSAVTESTEEQSTMEALDEIFEMGQREYSGAEDLDMGEAVDESTEYSPIMQNLFNEMETGPRLFGSQFAEKFSEAESLENLVEEMAPAFGSTQKSFEKAIESEIVSDEWDESLSYGVRVHLQIASNLCEDAITHISEVNNMESANQS